MTPVVVLYCLECEWDVSTWGYAWTDLEVLTAEHELLTAHEIGSVRIRRDRDGRLQVSSDLWQRDRDEHERTVG